MYVCNMHMYTCIYIYIYIYIYINVFNHLRENNISTGHMFHYSDIYYMFMLKSSHVDIVN